MILADKYEGLVRGACKLFMLFVCDRVNEKGSSSD